MLLDYFKYALSNLRHRKLRSWLTVVGIFIGIAAVVSLISLGQGLQNYIGQQFEQLGGDKIIIQAKTIGPPGSATNEEIILHKKDVKLIKQITGVEDAVGILMKSEPVEFNGEKKIVMLYGLNEDYFKLFGEIDATKIIAGRQLENKDQSKAVVGYNHIFGDTWDKSAVLSNKLKIFNKQFEIVGVVKKQGNPFDDNAVWLSKEVLAEMAGVKDEESMITAKTEKGYDTEKVAEEVKRKLRKERGEKEGQETFSVQTSSQLLQTFSDIFLVIQAVFVGIAAISLVVGGIGIMNTMYTSVLERTKEIGIMKAVGARNSDVLLIFLMESGLLGLVGGLIGVLAGMGIGKLVELIAAQAFGSGLIQAAFPWYLIAGALAFSFLVGSSAGLLPAMQAARMRPVDALRYE